MAKTLSTILGIIFIAVGIVGFFAPTLGGAHLSMAHNIVHLVSGALALYFGTAGSLSGAKIFCILFGIVYLLLGVAGFFAGAPGTPTMVGMAQMGADTRLLVVMPGQLELGTRDHILHVVIGLLFLIAGLATKTAPRVSTP